ncbi:hypothetical protein [Xenorhabdus bovienii]|uniref:hypothetical protein n=1 Tax=Xenorhabdus bovienii TaxID=40576 RepID=UPI003B8A7CA2|nr:hypothetical protein [Xenorhabdus bovienii]
MDYFLSNHVYTAENLNADYMAELANYSDTSWEAPQRAARLGAAVKRYKTSEMLCFIFSTVAYEFDPDLTPLTVKRLCNALFGRTGSQWLIVDIFGEKGRQQRSEDSNPDRIEQMAARFRTTAIQHWNVTLAEIERVKRKYQAEVKKT